MSTADFNDLTQPSTDPVPQPDPDRDRQDTLQAAASPSNTPVSDPATADPTRSGDGGDGGDGDSRVAERADPALRGHGLR